MSVSRWRSAPLMPGGASTPRQFAKTTGTPDSVSVGAAIPAIRSAPDTASSLICPDRICSTYSRTPDAAPSIEPDSKAGSSSPPPSCET